MKLAKYLADYLDHEHVCVMYYGEAGDIDDLKDIVQQGIEAFESTEAVTVRMVDSASGQILTDVNGNWRME